MNKQKSNRQSNEINVLGFGPIRLPAHDRECPPDEQAIKKRATILDLAASAQAAIRKLLHSKPAEKDE